MLGEYLKKRVLSVKEKGGREITYELTGAKRIDRA